MITSGFQLVQLMSPKNDHIIWICTFQSDISMDNVEISSSSMEIGSEIF